MLGSRGDAKKDANCCWAAERCEGWRKVGGDIVDVAAVAVVDMLIEVVGRMNLYFSKYSQVVLPPCFGTPWALDIPDTRPLADPIFRRLTRVLSASRFVISLLIYFPGV